MVEKENEIMAKVSIIVPIYNVEQYLVECMESIVHQTLKDIEIICVNDGSTDNSLKIIQDYAQKDKNIRTMRGESLIAVIFFVHIIKR